MNNDDLRMQAEYYRDLYRIGSIDREVAKEKIMPYLDFVNETSIRLSKKYNRKHKSVSFSCYVR